MPEGIVFEFLRSDEGVIDSEGYVYKVALFPLMFLDGLRLPFYRLVQDVLDMAGMASAQLHPNAWRILVGCCRGVA